MKNPVGSFGWADLTVNDAVQLRDFYKSVIGYTHTDVDMGDYNDFCLNSPDDGQTKAGICHARGSNEGLPPIWMIYFYVKDLDESLKVLESMGGRIMNGPKEFGGGARYAIIKDPAGAVCGLYQEG